ncbi:MAG: hypothetical protein K2Q26_15170 [Bdellovibrionales bacterium]|nr:hypothetical protein [Bdellovibrionales bacterium]
METHKNFSMSKFFINMVVSAAALLILFAVQQASAGTTAEYKCTSSCNFCVNYGKRTVCSEKFNDDSEDFEIAKRLSKMVNDGVIDPGSDLKTGFKVKSFSSKYFNCDFVAKKIQQWESARANLCKPSVAKNGKKTSNRAPASKKEPAVNLLEE